MDGVDDDMVSRKRPIPKEKDIMNTPDMVSDESRKAGEEETTSITVDHCSRYCSLQRVYGEFFTSK